MTGNDAAADTLFVSPLQIRLHTAFSAIRFGQVALQPEIEKLRGDLESRLAATLTELPPPLWHEAVSTIDRYAGAAASFYSLFHVPIWSFLHWVPDAQTAAPLDPRLIGDAKTAQALALFLHLWDDHLCDGQLPVDLLRLQVRTQAWQSYAAAAHRLADKVAPVTRIVEDHIDRYLTASQANGDVDDFDAFCRRFTDQIAIWTLVPGLLGQATGGEPAAIALRQVVESFSLAWRLLDDLQDIDRDLMAGVQSAVWHCLDASGRGAWQRCRAAWLSRNELDQRRWDELVQHVSHCGCVPRLLGLVDGHVVAAMRAAAAQGWSGMVAELAQSRPSDQFRAPAPPAS